MNRLLGLSLFLVILGLVLPSRGFTAERAILLTEGVQMKLGDAFAAEREFYRAITEYQKLLILFPDSAMADEARFKIGMAYYGGDEFDSAARAFRTLLEKHPTSRYAPAAGYQLGLSLWRDHRLDEAAAAFAAVAERYPASGDALRARLEGALVAFDNNNTTGSRRELERFLGDYPGDERAGKAREALALLDRELPRKSPLTAGLLSALLPGAGHLYAGHPGDGATSLLLNGLFIAGTVVAVRQENYAVAGVVGAIGLPFYLGNIYGAANAATKWNVSLRKDLRGNLAVTLESPF